ncbi:hypothetical protein CSPHI_03520 [Corynebacterium sphenisci DSM 44792]|uniref:Transport permease protein n=1 Tax=Corynebacterium sphenisci DSM 44792 TaxID=1437874 RepID=A0A1L7CWN6_9CORY|nr:ABC transporter permease [Corynebacterium sphenisci]APT90289.1 hypothetical protein CSPHI_03520 [Corynebacterium sphenisci DSM 44792]
MNPRLTLAVVTRVLRQVRADRRTVALVLVVPAVLLTLLRYVLDARRGLFDHIGVLLLALLPMMLMAILTSVVMQRERSGGTLERLWTTRLHRLDLLAGYAIAFTLLAAGQAVVLTGVLRLLLERAPAAGPTPQVLLGAVSGACGVAIGLLASAAARSEFQAVQAFPVLITPQVFLGGVFVPRESMPAVLEAVSAALPLSYAVDSSRALAAAGGGADAWTPLAAVAAFAVALAGAAALTLRRVSR